MRYPANILAIVSLIAVPVSTRAQPPEKLDPDHAAKMARGLDLFKKHVRPLLVEKCLKCHGGRETEAGLDITDREPLLKGGESGPAILAGRGKDSLLVKLIRHEREPKMPKGGGRLPDPVIAYVRDWIDLGAPYDKPLIQRDDPSAWTKKQLAPDARFHWAFQPLKRVEPPMIAGAATPIDRFIRAKLDATGLTPSAPAERRRLLRRVTLDLIGIPPTPEEIDAFVADRSPDAWAKVIDRLLASPRYGERWARHWLDLARFAESHGFEHDYDRPHAYHYRDFVIEALNRDLPYDTFVKWQLAGDEYASNDPLAWKATGFLAAGVHSTQITKNEAERHRYDELDDKVSTLTTAFLGLTVGCARCHDHKYDAIPQADYYRLVASFTKTVRSDYELDLDSEGYRKAKADFDTAHAPLVRQLQAFEKERLPQRFTDWQRAGKTLPPSWVIPEPKQQRSAGGATLAMQDDGSVLVSGKNPPIETLVFTFVTHQKGLKAVRLETLAHPSLVKVGPGRAANGNFALTDFKVTIAPHGVKGAAPTTVKLVRPRATFEQKGLPVSAAIDADPVTSGWAIDPQFGKDHAAIFEFESPVGFDGGTVIGVTMTFSNNVGHGIGRPRLSFATEPNLPLVAPALAESFKQALESPADKRTPAQTALLLKWYAPLDSEWQTLNRKVQDHLKKEPRPKKVKVLVCSEGLPPLRLHTQGDDFLPHTHYLRRGDPNQKDGIADQGFLQALSMTGKSFAPRPAPKDARTPHLRTNLAEWLTNVESGAGRLLARVIVNRLWQHHLGRGIVATPSDFGTRGEPPTHPELLDWLATEMIRQGWSLKAMHKLILTCAVYQQDSTYDESKASIDRDNKLFWRYTPRRLEGEAIRDSILAVSGRLDATMYGPGTLDEGSVRRSIYFTVKRSKLIPMMQVFDAPDALAGLAERPATTVAPQALYLMNNPHIRTSAKALAARVAPNTGVSPAEAIRRAYAITLSRAPNAAELADAVAFIESQTVEYRGKPPAEARQLALTDFCQSLFCLNEFAFTE